MTGYERIIRLMRQQGAANNPTPLQFGEMTSATTCMVGDLKLEKDDFLVAEHLTDHEITVSVSGWKTEDKSGGSGYAEFARHKHDIEVSKKKITIHNALKKGDLVLVQRMSDEQYIIIERLVEL